MGGGEPAVGGGYGQETQAQGPILAPGEKLDQVSSICLGSTVYQVLYTPILASADKLDKINICFVLLYRVSGTIYNHTCTTC